MADKRQSRKDTPRNTRRGAGQVIVNLCIASESGVVFWSRHRFDLAAELQLRVRTEVLPMHLRAALKSDARGWATVRGYVVECLAVRRPDGAAVFRVSLMLDAMLIPETRRRENHARLFFGGRTGVMFGLN